MDVLLQYPLVWFLTILAIGLISSLAGGALAGIAIGGRQFGWQLATQMGGLFGLLAGFPGTALAFLVLILIG